MTAKQVEKYVKRMRPRLPKFHVGDRVYATICRQLSIYPEFDADTRVLASYAGLGNLPPTYRVQGFDRRIVFEDELQASVKSI